MQIQPETIIWNQPSASPGLSKPAERKEVFRLEKFSGDRINGSMPVWGQPKTPEEEITASLAAAGKAGGKPELVSSLAETETPAEEGFGFLDVVDMVNPLQHIPIVGSIYRNLTGDAIKPVSRIIGGAAFGGPLGAAAGAVNALVQMETGKDVTDNLVASISEDAPPAHDTTIAMVNLAAAQNRYNS